MLQEDKPIALRSTYANLCVYELTRLCHVPEELNKLHIWLHQFSIMA